MWLSESREFNEICSLSLIAFISFMTIKEIPFLFASSIPLVNGP
jgi:hypothetical protein